MTKQELVDEVLFIYPETRGDDIKLIAKSGLHADKITESEARTLERILRKLGSPETYTRARRTAQKKNPFLRPDEGTQKMRRRRSRLMRDTRGDVDKTNDIMF